MNSEDTAYVLQWYEKADLDLSMAHRALEREPYILSPACFHCQQAVEKYLKAYLAYQRIDIRKTHSLDALLLSCAEYDHDFDSLDFKNLEDFAVDSRYPDDLLIPTLDEAKEYLQMAENIKKLVRNKVIF